MKIQNQPSIAFSMNRYQRNEWKMEKTIEKLGTGLNIRRASDDPTGLALSETMRTQIRGLSQAQRNMQDGLSMLQAANEGLNNVNALLQRAGELAVLNANGTLTENDRQKSQVELDQLMESINDTATKLQFNTKQILGENTPLVLMVGPTPGELISLDLIDTSTTALGLDGTNLLTADAASNLITKLNEAISQTTSNLTKMGAYYESIEHHMQNALLKESNLTSSFSSMVDTDMAKEMMQFVSLGIRQKGDQLLISNVSQQSTDVLNIVLK
ncbi:flagellin [Metabacillus fastidiosus]|uniref:flagellin N-terminal helical domain-containing protein n=1 Tax=Metabacillus fastidiosus TaxID=1458 RepID=UPI003D2D2B0F